MRPKMIQVIMGKYLVQVPRFYLVDPTEQDKVTYDRASRFIKNFAAFNFPRDSIEVPWDWELDLIDAEDLLPKHLPNNVDDLFQQYKQSKNLQKLYDKAEAEGDYD